MAIRTHVIYRGRVQGVGFRATAMQLAAGLDLSGFVRNLHDGTVELEAQGQPDQVQRLLDSIASTFGDDIRDVSTQSRDPRPDDQPGFRITY
jgi:acylphosphatase